MMFNYCPSCGQKGSVKELDKTNYECGNCHWHFWNNSKAGVSLLFIKEGHILLSKRADEPAKGSYDLPGGFVDFNEDAYEAAIREAHEEMNIRIKRGDLVLLETYPTAYLPTVHNIDLLFVVRHWEGEFRPSDDCAALEWKPFSFVAGAEFSPGYPAFADFLNKRFSSGATNGLQ